MKRRSTYVKRVDEISADEFIEPHCCELRKRAGESFEADGIPVKSSRKFSYQADIRYSGQAFQLSLSVTEDELDAKGLCRIDRRVRSPA